jgi:hypothetical protein
LREITPDDFAEIASFTEPFGFDPLRSRAEWEHLWVKNPANIAAGNRFPIGWILKAGGRMIGHIASIPTRYRLGNRQLFCASGRAWAVVPEYRGYSQLLLHTYLQQSGIDLALTNTANELSCRVHFELGASVVPVGRWDVSPAWITGYLPLLADWLGRKKKIQPIRPLLYPVAAALATKDSWNRLQVKVRARRDLELAVQFSFDERFDDFWKQLCTRYPNKLLADRSLATLQWHFHYAMAEGRLWIVTAARDRQLLGYAVFVRDPYRRVGSKISRAVLADFQSLEADAGMYFAMLQSALEKCSREGIPLLAANGFSASGTETGRYAPYRRKLENPQFLYKAADPELAKLLAGPEPWCPSSYDADETL